MPAANVDDLITMLLTAKNYLGWKPTVATKAAGIWTSLWTVAGASPAGATPATGAGAVPTNATTGALPFVDPQSGFDARLTRFGVVCTLYAQVMLYDRLWHNSGLSGSSTSPQTVNSAALTRPDADGEGAELWAEIYTAIGAGTYNITVDYTNPAGTGSRSAVLTTPGSTYANLDVARTMVPIRLQAGDTGIKSVQSVTLSASSGATGDFGLTILRPLAIVSVPRINVVAELDLFRTALAQIHPDACLAMMIATDTTASGVLRTFYQIAEDAQ